MDHLWIRYLFRIYFSSFIFRFLDFSATLLIIKLERVYSFIYESNNSRTAIFPDSRFSSTSEVSQQHSQRLEDGKEPKLMTNALSSASLKKKKKKSHSLVRKLSLNKFRMSSEQQEPRHTPEGGNSSRSQSQSSQDSPVHTYIHTTKKENDDALERERERGTKEELKKPEKLLEKTIRVVQRKSPSLTIKSFAETVHQGEPCMDAMDCWYRYLHETEKRYSFFNDDFVKKRR